MNEVRVFAANHPLRHLDRVDKYVPEGKTLLEMLEEAQPDPVLRRHAVISIGEHPIPRHNWHLVRPKAGSSVYIHVRATGGGGKSPLRLILTLAVLAAAFTLPGAILGGTLASQVAFGGITYGTLAGAAIAPTGRLLISATPPEPRA